LPTLGTPDALHLATAIWHGCDKLWTFDENDKKSGKSAKRGLIPLTGTVGGKYPLCIELPDASPKWKAAKMKALLDASQLSLDDLSQENEDEDADAESDE
jgi:hypothetical protein